MKNRKNMEKSSLLLVLILILVMLAACNRAPAATRPEDTMAPTEPAEMNTATTTPMATATPIKTATPVKTATPKVTIPVATVTPVVVTTETPVPTEKPAQPVLLVNMVAKQGTALEQLDCQQLVLVAVSGSNCKLYTYECSQNGLWSMVTSTSGYVGEKGVADDKWEGDKKTPAGIYALGFAFGHDADPTTNYPYRKITSDSYWVDDSDSKYYNQWVTGTADKDWDSAENLWKIKTEYALAVLIEYNYGNATVPGKGSAIFLHVGNKPTAGCVAIPKSDLKTLLGWLDESKAPQIIISEG